MKKLLIAVTIFSSAAAAWGQQASQGSGASESGADPNQMICRRMATTGSRVSSERVCMTRADWDTHRRETKANIDNAQTRRGVESY